MEIYLHPDRRALIDEVSAADMAVSATFYPRELLKASSYFEGCAALDDPIAIFECAAELSHGCASEQVACGL